MIYLKTALVSKRSLVVDSLAAGMARSFWLNLMPENVCPQGMDNNRQITCSKQRLSFIGPVTVICNAFTGTEQP